jgi:hypothetical protein
VQRTTFYDDLMVPGEQSSAMTNAGFVLAEDQKLSLSTSCLISLDTYLHGTSSRHPYPAASSDYNEPPTAQTEERNIQSAGRHDSSAIAGSREGDCHHRRSARVVSKSLAQAELFTEAIRSTAPASSTERPLTPRSTPPNSTFPT